MKKFFAMVLAVVMVVGLFAGCGKQSGFDGKTIKLGFSGPLTGDAAMYGNAAKNAIELAIKEVNALGGIQFELNAKDDVNDAEKAVSAYNDLVDWGMQIMIGTVTTTPCIAVAAEANKDRVFCLTPSASSTEVTAGKDNMFQICFTDPNQGSASALYIHEHMPDAKVAVIYDNSSAYSNGIYQNFVNEAKVLGLNVVSEMSCNADTIDYTVQLDDAQNNGADLVFLPIYCTPASAILNQANTDGYKPVFFGVDGMDGILSIDGFDTKLAEGVMLLTPFAADAPDQKTQDFVAAYKAAYGETPNQFAADAYDCVYALYQAVNNAQLSEGASVSEICDAMIAQFTTMTFSGLTGADMTWDAEGQVSKAPAAVVIENGVYVDAG